jgi:leader peptidase (prepilin peptidase)/N-methyltransferase
MAITAMILADVAAGLVALAGVMAGLIVNVVVRRLPMMLERNWRAESLHMLGLTAELQVRPAMDWGGDRLGVGIVAACVGISQLVTWHSGFGWEALSMLLLSWGLLCLALIDAEHFLLPDFLVIPLLWVGLMVNAFGVIITLQDAVLGAAFGYLSLWGINQLYGLLRGVTGIGNGDFKLFALLGAWGGWQVLPVILLGAAIFGCVWWLIYSRLGLKKQGTYFPFGPSLALAGGLAILFDDSSRYFSLILTF